MMLLKDSTLKVLKSGRPVKVQGPLAWNDFRALLQTCAGKFSVTVEPQRPITEQ